MSNKHECTQWKEHESKEYHILTEIENEGNLLVFDTFTKVTPKEHRKKHPDMFQIPIDYCPFCGIKLESGSLGSETQGVAAI